VSAAAPQRCGIHRAIVASRRSQSGAVTLGTAFALHFGGASYAMSGKGAQREQRSLEDLPFDFGVFLSLRLGVSPAEARVRLGSWLRDLDRARHGWDRFRSESSASASALGDFPWGNTG
jgi:hypothetical protein